MEIGGSREDSPGSSAEEPGARANLVSKMTGSSSQESVNKPDSLDSVNKPGGSGSNTEVNSNPTTSVSGEAQSGHSHIDDDHQKAMDCIIQRVENFGPGNEAIFQFIQRMWSPLALERNKNSEAETHNFIGRLECFFELRRHIADSLPEYGDDVRKHLQNFPHGERDLVCQFLLEKYGLIDQPLPATAQSLPMDLHKLTPEIEIKMKEDLEKDPSAFKDAFLKFLRDNTHE